MKEWTAGGLPVSRKCRESLKRGRISVVFDLHITKYYQFEKLKEKGFAQCTTQGCVFLRIEREHSTVAEKRGEGSR